MSQTNTLLKRYVGISILATIGIAGSAAGASMLIPISGAIIAPGQVIVESNLRKVQHSTGGIVGKLNVVEGQYVKQNDVLIRLDDTVTRANLEIVLNELFATMARRARLQAERDKQTKIVFLPELLERAKTDADVATTMAGEKRLLEARAATREGQKSQLTERIKQLKEESEGASLQLTALRSQNVLAKEELADLETLFQKNLIPRPRVSQIQREVMRIDGSIGELVARRAQIGGKIAETELQILQVDVDHFTEIAKDIREAETKIRELGERRIAAEDQLARIEIKAPIAGQIHQLLVHTVGGVVTPGEALMMIVPNKEQLVVEAKLNITDIDEVVVGQKSRIRLTSFNQATTPELNGTVVRIAGDQTKDQQTGLTYFVAAVRIPQEELDRLGNRKLVPGMPAEVHMQTSDRTIASFLLKPLRDHMNRSMRET